MELPIILIGPMSAGKSTIAKVLAEKLSIPHYEVDDERWTYFDELGYDKKIASQLADSDEGMIGLIRYWKPFEVGTLERVLVDHADSVIDFGAGYTVQEDAALFARVVQALAPYPNVILLLPSPDLDESVEEVNARFTALLLREVGTVDPRLLEVNKNFVKHPANHQLAKIVVYTKEKTTDETCAEIISKLK